MTTVASLSDPAPCLCLHILIYIYIFIYLLFIYLFIYIYLSIYTVLWQNMTSEYHVWFHFQFASMAARTWIFWPRWTQPQERAISLGTFFTKTSGWTKLGRWRSMVDHLTGGLSGFKSENVQVGQHPKSYAKWSPKHWPFKSKLSSRFSLGLATWYSSLSTTTE